MSKFINRFTGKKVFLDWRGVLIFLVVFQLLLNAPGLIGASQNPLRHGVPKSLANPRLIPNIWARWDSEWYLLISQEGYSQSGQDLAFFPLYPILIHIFSFGNRALGTWAGYIISFAAFILAGVILWKQVNLEFNAKAAWFTVLSMVIFPTAVFFSAIYTESLFFLLSVLVYWFSVREKYALAAVFVSLASITRLTGIVLILIPLVEILSRKPPRAWIKLIYTGCVSLIGLVIYGTYLWVTHGSPLAFINIQSSFGRTNLITWPWKTFIDSFRVAFFGYGGLSKDFLMRSTSGLEVFCVVLFGFCILAMFFLLRKSLFAFSFTTLFLLLLTHGPSVFGLWSMSRYVLALFPCFIVLGIAMNKLRWLKLAWILFFVVFIYLTICYTNGRWVD